MNHPKCEKVECRLRSTFFAMYGKLSLKIIKHLYSARKILRIK